RVELGRVYTQAELGHFGELEMLGEREVRFCVQREDLTRTVSQLLAELDVIDLSVADPPVEEVIGRVFQAGVVA
ncbi:MAG: ABC transporter, partial [Anaerolineae bacterium]|nr:ABC transporter [Gloeobacterales cyanobacterium ES-bin-313]